MSVEARVNEVADQIAKEGMIVRASRVREGACEIARQRHEIDALRTTFAAFSKAVSMPGGPSLAVQRHDPSWEAWKRLCDAFARNAK